MKIIASPLERNAAPLPAKILATMRGSWRKFPALAAWASRKLKFRRQVQRVRQAEILDAQIQKLLDLAPDAMAIVDGDGKILQANRQVEAIFGYTRTELPGTVLEEFLPERLRTIHRAHRANYVSAPRTRAMGIGLDLYGRRKGGAEFPVEVSLSPMELDGRLLVICTIRDISERKRAEEALQESEERFSNAFEYAAIGMALVGLDGSFLKVNRALCHLVGYTEQELLHKTFQDITHPDDLATDLDYVRQLLAGERRAYQMEKRYIHKLGHVVWVLLSGSLVQDSHGHPAYFIAQIQDFTERKQAEENVRYLSTHDPLTGLYNRTYFEEELGRLQQSRRYPVGIVVADMDGLKTINDSLGHAAGDQALQQAAETLKRAVRAEDMVARIGGDEFVVLLPNTDGATVDKAVARMRAYLRTRATGNFDGPAFNLSIGKATAEKGEMLAEALKAADERMYQEKYARRARQQEDFSAK
ncbi:MAG: PAS domain S-box protein [Chloroflexi bacterium]|nr:PAS domain S-box protein [Chloroflexota bacterium]